MNDTFIDEELHSLALKRRWLFIGFPIIFVVLFVLAIITCHYVFRIDGDTTTGLFCFIGMFLPPFFFFYCLSKYNESVRKTAYLLITQHHAHWSLLKKEPQDDNLFESATTELGLLSDNEFINWHNYLRGERDTHTFTLQDISWMAIRGSGAGQGPVTKAQYTLLTVFPKQIFPCSILIRKHKLFKGKLKHLERLKLQHKEFEKLYDIYTDNPAQSIGLLQPEFTQALVRYVHTTKKQVELIVTPDAIFALYNTGIWKKIFSPVIFRHPRVQCEKIFKEINDILDILFVVSLLENPQD